MLNGLIPKIGFASAVRASAYLILGLLIIANLCMSTRLPPKKDRPPTPKVALKKILTDVPYIVGVIGVRSSWSQYDIHVQSHARDSLSNGDYVSVSYFSNMCMS
jgi:hypothetical protein